MFAFDIQEAVWVGCCRSHYDIVRDVYICMQCVCIDVSGSLLGKCGKAKVQKEQPMVSNLITVYMRQFAAELRLTSVLGWSIRQYQGKEMAND